MVECFTSTASLDRCCLRRRGKSKSRCGQADRLVLRGQHRDFGWPPGLPEKADEVFGQGLTSVVALLLEPQGLDFQVRFTICVWSHMLLALATFFEDAFTPPAASRLFSLAAGGTQVSPPFLLVLELVAGKEGSSSSWDQLGNA